MKKFLSIILALVFCISSLSIYAYAVPRTTYDSYEVAQAKIDNEKFFKKYEELNEDEKVKVRTQLHKKYIMVDSENSSLSVDESIVDKSLIGDLKIMELSSVMDYEKRPDQKNAFIEWNTDYYDVEFCTSNEYYDYLIKNSSFKFDKRYSGYKYVVIKRGMLQAGDEDVIYSDGMFGFSTTADKNKSFPYEGFSRFCDYPYLNSGYGVETKEELYELIDEKIRSFEGNTIPLPIGEPHDIDLCLNKSDLGYDGIEITYEIAKEIINSYSLPEYLEPNTLCYQLNIGGTIIDALRSAKSSYNETARRNLLRIKELQDHKKGIVDFLENCQIDWDKYVSVRFNDSNFYTITLHCSDEDYAQLWENQSIGNYSIIYADNEFNYVPGGLIYESGSEITEIKEEPNPIVENRDVSVENDYESHIEIKESVNTHETTLYSILNEIVSKIKNMDSAVFRNERESYYVKYDDMVAALIIYPVKILMRSVMIYMSLIKNCYQ